MQNNSKDKNNNREVKSIVAEILNIPNDTNWDIVDSNKNLVLVHYSKSANLSLFGHIRGTVIDIVERKIICHGTKRPRNIISNSIDMDSDGIFRHEDVFGNQVELNLSKCKILEGYEGTMINVFKYKGYIHFTTAKRLDAKGKFGIGYNNMSFEGIYNYITNGKINLFPSKKFDDYCYKIILVSEETAIVSKRNNLNFLIYTENQDISELANSESNSNELENILRKPEILNIEDANNLLQFGFTEDDNIVQSKDANESKINEDYRLGNGEFVIIEDENKNTYMVKSRSYDYRESLMGNSSNLLYQFFSLTSYATSIKNSDSSSKELELYLEKFPMFKTCSNSVELIVKKVLNENVYVQGIETEVNPTKFDRIILLKNIWLAFLLSVPKEKQKFVVQFFDIFIFMKTKIVKTLLEIYKNEDFENSFYDNNRIIQILNTAKYFTGKKINENQDINKAGEKIPYDHLFEMVLRNIINKESGSSLYNIALKLISIEMSSGNIFTPSDIELIFLRYSQIKLQN